MRGKEVLKNLSEQMAGEGDDGNKKLLTALLRR
jgi:hypothetical protein